MPQIRISEQTRRSLQWFRHDNDETWDATVSHLLDEVATARERNTYNLRDALLEVRDRVRAWDAV